MRNDPLSLLSLLLSSLASGVVLGVLYDVIRISRVLLGVNHYVTAIEKKNACPKLCQRQRKQKRPRLVAALFQIVLAVQDILYCLTIGAVAAVLMFYHNNGVFRSFVIVGILLGIVAYLLTVGKLVIRASEYVVFSIKRVTLYVVYYTSWPFVALFRVTYRAIAGILARQKRGESREGSPPMTPSTWPTLRRPPKRDFCRDRPKGKRRKPTYAK